MVDSLLEKVIGLDYKLKGGGQRWRNTEQHSSLVLDLQEGAFFWNSRGISGRPIDYLTKVKGLSRKQAEELINDLSGISSVSKPHKGEISTPNEKLVKVFWENGKNDRDYWYRRCLKDSTIDSFRLGKYDSFFMIPIYYKDIIKKLSKIYFLSRMPGKHPLKKAPCISCSILSLSYSCISSSAMAKFP